MENDLVAGIAYGKRFGCRYCLKTYGSKFIEICVLSWRRGPYLNSQSIVHSNQSEIRHLFKITKQQNKTNKQTGIIVFCRSSIELKCKNTYSSKTKTGQIHTVQKHTQNRPSTLRGQDKWLFVFWQLFECFGSIELTSYTYIRRAYFNSLLLKGKQFFKSQKQQNT